MYAARSPLLLAAAVALLLVSLRADAAPPADCSNTVNAAAVTLTFNPTDTAYTYTSDGCTYSGGLIVTSSVANGPLLNTQIRIRNGQATTLNIQSGVNIGSGSSLTISGMTATGLMTMAATLSGTVTALIDLCTLTNQLTLSSALLYGSKLVVSNTNIQTTTANGILVSGATMNSNSQLHLLNVNATTTGTYGMYMTGSAMSNSFVPALRCASIANTAST